MPEPFKVICCPDKKTHKDYDKRLLVLGQEEIYVHCAKSGWIKIELYRADKKISYDGVGVVVSMMPKNHHFEMDKMPVLSLVG